MDIKLIKIAQQKFEELYGHDEWMRVFMKNYLDQEDWRKI
jgi:hypothetical protein